MKKNIGIIGFGNMGSAIAERIKTKYNVVVFDLDRAKTKNVSEIRVVKNSIDLVRNVEIVILAVKPQDFDSVLNEIKDYTKSKLIISIAAGITTKCIEDRLREASVIRVMPNLPARVGKGMICLYKGKSATDKDLNFSEGLFSNLGETLILNDENMINAATAVSGSGPGFLYDAVTNKSIEEIKKYANDFFIPSLAGAAEKIGFTPEQAMRLAKVTSSGSVIFLEQTNLSPSDAKNLVVSKKGTTEAGLEVLHKGGSLEEAVRAALKRAEELSKKE